MPEEDGRHLKADGFVSGGEGVALFRCVKAKLIRKSELMQAAWCCVHEIIDAFNCSRSALFIATNTSRTILFRLTFSLPISKKYSTLKCFSGKVLTP
jgi:hypothetical protein